MILIKLAKNKNKTIKEAYGKYYARPVVTETIGIDELAEHMASHNTPFSKGAIKGLLTGNTPGPKARGCSFCAHERNNKRQSDEQ